MFIGILAARFIAGILTDFGGWRMAYPTSAVLTANDRTTYARSATSTFADCTDSYNATLRSILLLFLRDQILLFRGILALLVFATFSTFWTGLVFPLSPEPFFYSHTQIGLFGLVGLVGAIAATGAGKLADREYEQQVAGFSLALLLASWRLIAFLPRSIAALLIDIVLLDLSVQAVYLTNQSIIFDYHPNARSRLVGSYMIFYSIGSAIARSSQLWLRPKPDGLAYRC